MPGACEIRGDDNRRAEAKSVGMTMTPNLTS